MQSAHLNRSTMCMHLDTNFKEENDRQNCVHYIYRLTYSHRKVPATHMSVSTNNPFFSALKGQGNVSQVLSID